MKPARSIFLLLFASLDAQDRMTLRQAIDTALSKHPSMEAGAARIDAAANGVAAAKSGYLPKLNYTESWQRSNNPVFVFSSLLTQHQFRESNFQIGPLNRPDALDNFQSQLSLTQSVYDGGLNRAQIGLAKAAHDLTIEQKRAAGMDLTAAVVRAYFGALLADAELKSAEQAVKSAESDLQRAQSIRAAGMSTDADVLSIRVHLAAVRQQEIRRRYDIEVARAALNELLGLSLDAAHELSTPLEASPARQPTETSALESSAVSERPETREARLRMRLAEQQSEAARAALRPRLGARFGFEADRQRVFDRGGANWLAGVSFEWNLLGFSERARRAEAEQAVRAANAEAKQAETAVRVAVRRAGADLKSAEEQLGVAEAAVAMADESLRITKNRFDNGMAAVTELLRNETAALDARTRRLAAVYEQRIAEVNLEYATGTLK